MGRLILRSSVTSGGGGSEPAFGDAGFNDATQLATGTTIIFDLRQDYSTRNVLDVSTAPFETQTMIRPASYTYQPSGGYWGTGGARFVMGYFTDPEDEYGQHNTGLGELDGFDAAAGGSCTSMSVGFLARFGSTWITEPDGNKSLIVKRDGGGGARPMIIPKEVNVATNQVLGACDGTVCQFSDDGPNQIDLVEVWQWIQMEIDTAGAGRLTTRVWDEDGIFTGSGISVMERAMLEGTGGTLPGIDIINAFVNSVETPTANCWMEMCYAEVWLNVATGMTPPAGFPGSAR